MIVTNNITNNVNKVMPNIQKRILSDLFKAVLKCGGLVKTEAMNRVLSKKIASALKVVPRNVNGMPESNTGLSRKTKGWYGKFLESGTEPHDIKPKHGKTLSWITKSGGRADFTTRTGKKVSLKYYVAKNGQHTLDASKQGRSYAMIVHHPGIKAKPFLWPAYLSKKAEIKQVIGDAVVGALAEGTREIRT